MKKALALVLVLLLAFSALAFGGPFVRFDLTIPNTADLTFGIKDDGLTLAVVVDDLFVTPGLGLTATYKSQFDWWDSKFDIGVDNIDMVTYYPIPVIDGITAGWLGTLHIGGLLASLASEEGSAKVMTPYTFDVYGGIDFDYDASTHALLPTGKIGFYWEL